MAVPAEREARIVVSAARPLARCTLAQCHLTRWELVEETIARLRDVGVTGERERR
jgi:hypothetical protein